MSGPMREMTPEEIAAGIVSRKRPRKWLAADLNAIIERAEERARRERWLAEGARYEDPLTSEEPARREALERLGRAVEE